MEWQHRRIISLLICRGSPKPPFSAFSPPRPFLTLTVPQALGSWLLTWLLKPILLLQALRVTHLVIIFALPSAQLYSYAALASATPLPPCVSPEHCLDRSCSGTKFLPIHHCKLIWRKEKRSFFRIDSAQIRLACCPSSLPPPSKPSSCLSRFSESKPGPTLKAQYRSELQGCIGSFPPYICQGISPALMAAPPHPCVWHPHTFQNREAQGSALPSWQPHSPLHFA